MDGKSRFILRSPPSGRSLQFLAEGGGLQDGQWLEWTLEIRGFHYKHIARQEIEDALGGAADHDVVDPPARVGTHDQEIDVVLTHEPDQDIRGRAGRQVTSCGRNVM